MLLRARSRSSPLPPNVRVLCLCLLEPESPAPPLLLLVLPHELLERPQRSRSSHRRGPCPPRAAAACTQAERDGAAKQHRVIEEAVATADAGAFAIVVEGVAEDLAREITEAVAVPTSRCAPGTATAATTPTPRAVLEAMKVKPA